MSWKDILKSKKIWEELELKIRTRWRETIEDELDRDTPHYSDYGQFDDAQQDIMRRAKNITRNIMPDDEEYTDAFNTWWKEGTIVEEQWQESIDSELGKTVQPLFTQFLKDIYTHEYIMSEWDDRKRESESAARTQAGEMGYNTYSDGTYWRE